jgi:hypothetical protein
LIIRLVFEKYANFFCQKLPKNALNWDHNIDPWSPWLIRTNGKWRMGRRQVATPTKVSGFISSNRVAQDGTRFNHFYSMHSNKSLSWWISLQKMKKFLQTPPPITKAIWFFTLYLLNMFQPWLGSSSSAFLQLNWIFIKYVCHTIPNTLQINA